MRPLLAILVVTVGSASPAAAQTVRWPVRLEEPTGIERRHREAVTLSATFAPGLAWPERLLVVDAEGTEAPSQVVPLTRHPDGSVRAAEVLFEASVVPGTRPVYSLLSLPAATPRAAYATDLVVRHLGTSRLEIANSRFGVVLNLGRDGTVPALVEAYHRGAAAERMVNLVETTPDLKGAIPLGVRSAGWSTAARGAERSGGFTSVEIVESGPLRARVVLAGAKVGGANERWEFEWLARSPVLRWRTTVAGATGEYGFVFSALSATPYVPFTHWMDGREDWPTGWDTDDPPHRAIGPTNLDDLPGGQVVYYHPSEDYGALAFLEIDRALTWRGAGGAEFTATTEGPPGAPRRLEVAVAFPAWKGTETQLEARATGRRHLQPVLAQQGEAERLDRTPAVRSRGRVPEARVVEEPMPDMAEAAPAIPMLALDGEWRLQDADKGAGERAQWFAESADDRAWRTVRVPGTVHAQILTPDEYFSKSADWISRQEWWYRRRFRMPATLRGERYRLRFGATDYYADIWVNGRHVAFHEGYVDPYEVDVTDVVRLDGENVIAVRVWTPVSYYWRHRPWTVKGSYGAVDQKPDDITAVGITRPVSLVAYGPLVVEDVAIRTSLVPDGSAHVDVDVTVSGSAEPGDLDLVLSPRTFTSPLRWRARVEVPAGPGPHRLAARFHVKEPRLWWTRDHGRPDLYRLTVRASAGGALSDGRVETVGIREIEKVGWVFYLNGRRLFIRGTNTYYFQLFLSEVTRATYERDLEVMADMNINMVRLHCHFQNPEFYDVADEMGLLVWQDYLEAWYPRDVEFARHAARLYDAHIRLARNHPSVALWATSDEEDIENYRVLTKHLAGRLFALDPERRAVVRSTGRYGDAHVYHGWYGGSIWSYARETEAFISELGATALPNYDSLMRFLPNHWPIEPHRDDWVFRKLQIGEAMQAWGPPGERSLQEYIPVTQAYVARLHQLAIERLRRRKYDAGGILHFHAVDFWPSVTMAAVDYYRSPTKSYDTVRRSFQMVLATIEYDRDTFRAGQPTAFPLWVVNDRWDAVPGAVVSWRVVGPGGVEASGELPRSTVPADSSQRVGEVRWTPSGPGAVRLVTEVRGADGTLVSENLYEFSVR